MKLLRKKFFLNTSSSWPVKCALNWYKYVITANLSGTVNISMSAGSITLGMPRVSPASNAFLQLPLTSCGNRELMSLEVFISEYYSIWSKNPQLNFYCMCYYLYMLYKCVDLSSIKNNHENVGTNYSTQDNDDFQMFINGIRE